MNITPPITTADYEAALPITIGGYLGCIIQHDHNLCILIPIKRAKQASVLAHLEANATITRRTPPHGEAP